MKETGSTSREVLAQFGAWHLLHAAAVAADTGQVMDVAGACAVARLIHPQSPGGVVPALLVALGDMAGTMAGSTEIVLDALEGTPEFVAGFIRAGALDTLSAAAENSLIPTAETLGELLPGLVERMGITGVVLDVAAETDAGFALLLDELWGVGWRSQSVGEILASRAWAETVGAELRGR